MAAVWPLITAAVASANGPCGQNTNGNAACPLSFPSTVPCALLTANESDYYVFSAPAGAQLFVTVTNTAAPTCDSCGTVGAELYDAQGNDTDVGTGNSYPQSGITVSRSFAYTIGTAGTYTSCSAAASATTPKITRSRSRTRSW